MTLISYFKWNVFFYILTSIILMEGMTAQITDPVATEVWEPEPRIVTPGLKTTAPPSDAIVLFDGSNANAWQHHDEKPVQWKVQNGEMTVVKGTGSIFTKQEFGDVQLHIEWSAPTVIEGEGQGRGNSGVFLQNVYEVQILDSYDNRTYSNGQAGAVYKQHLPLVNAMKAPGEWQVYDIIYKAPTFNTDGMLTSPAYVTVLHNGVLIQNHAEIKGPVQYIGLPKYVAHGKLPIQLQDHGNPVKFRNIWVREL